MNNKILLLLFYEYVLRYYCEVYYEIEVEINGLFEVIVVIGGLSRGVSGILKKGFGVGRNKVRVK